MSSLIKNYCSFIFLSGRIDVTQEAFPQQLATFFKIDKNHQNTL